MTKIEGSPDFIPPVHKIVKTGDALQKQKEEFSPAAEKPLVVPLNFEDEILLSPEALKELEKDKE